LRVHTPYAKGKWIGSITAADDKLRKGGTSAFEAWQRQLDPWAEKRNDASLPRSEPLVAVLNWARYRRREDGITEPEVDASPGQQLRDAHFHVSADAGV
jgi:hypothetical protein